MVLCLGEPPVRFLWCCWSLFHFCIFIYRCSSFCCCSSFTFSFPRHPPPFRGLSPGFLHPILYFQSSPSQSDSRHFHFSTIPFIFLPRALRPWVGIFYLQALCTLRSFTDILTCVYQGFPGIPQFFLEVCRTSYWSSKHRPRPSDCLIDSNP